MRKEAYIWGVAFMALIMVTLCLYSAVTGPSTSITERDLRDYKQLDKWLEYNATRETVSTKTTTNLTITSAYYGQTILFNTNAACPVTLPANAAAAGSWVKVGVHGSASDDCAITVSAATADTLVGPNDVDLDSITWATGHRINAMARFWSDGVVWHVQNQGGTTMTYTD